MSVRAKSRLQYFIYKKLLTREKVSVGDDLFKTLKMHIFFQLWEILRVVLSNEWKYNFWMMLSCLYDSITSVWYHHICMILLRLYDTITSVWYHHICMIPSHLYDSITSVWFYHVCMIPSHVYDTITSVWYLAVYNIESITQRRYFDFWRTTVFWNYTLCMNFYSFKGSNSCRHFICLKSMINDSITSAW